MTNATARAPRPQAEWIEWARPVGQTRMDLICLPYAGGGASVFREWQVAAPAHLRIGTVQLPGRETRFLEPPLTRMDEVVAELLPLLTRRPGDRPFALLGHSLGGLIAFELTFRLQRAGAALPTRLFLSGTRPPHIPDPHPIHHLDDKGFAAGLRLRNGTPDEILENEELAQIFLPIIRADLAIAETWHGTGYPPFACPVAILTGLSDDVVPTSYDPEWSRYDGAGMARHRFDADHFFIRTHRAEMQAIVFGALGRDRTASGMAAGAGA